MITREENGIAEFECCYAIDVDILKNGLAYKYCVRFSQRKEYYEYLHGLKVPENGTRNRYFKVIQTGNIF